VKVDELREDRTQQKRLCGRQKMKQLEKVRLVPLHMMVPVAQFETIIIKNNRSKLAGTDNLSHFSRDELP
jgi:hypothetical protein